ncbi:hypothetical protein HJG60_007866 [Phyllostomus discolor]|uniref:Uncharacterized protein n=1 Tax=Phyllostomus discolor TaxID=89673 RepID=A0A834EV81_9CHIR|nr:hypothetical protein HJG60_007866 [Phyllostomus discolor]
MSFSPWTMQFLPRIPVAGRLPLRLCYCSRVGDISELLSEKGEKEAAAFPSADTTPPPSTAEALAAVWARRAHTGGEPSRRRCQSARPPTPVGDMQHPGSGFGGWLIHSRGHTAPEPHALLNTSGTGEGRPHRVCVRTLQATTGNNTGGASAPGPCLHRDGEQHF